jgi:hypothetical protein
VLQEYVATEPTVVPPVTVPLLGAVGEQYGSINVHAGVLPLHIPVAKQESIPPPEYPALQV